MNNENQENMMTNAEEFVDNSGEVLCCNSSESCGCRCKCTCPCTTAEPEADWTENNESEGGNSESCGCPCVDNTTPESDWVSNQGASSGGSDECCCCNNSTPLVISSRWLLMKPGMKTELYVKGSIHWSSNNPSVATVDSSSGLVTAVSDGVAIITATVKDGRTITCTITVDHRERVRVYRQQNYLHIKFMDCEPGLGQCWHFVGKDLDDSNNLTGALWDEYYFDVQKQYEKNCRQNCEYIFSPQQLGFLYRLDPFGVVQYVKRRAYFLGEAAKQKFQDPLSTEAFWEGKKAELQYKDEIYWAIFGLKKDDSSCENEYKKNHFFFTQLETASGVDIVYKNYDIAKYMNRVGGIHSLAEFLFGGYNTFDSSDFLKNIVKKTLEAIGESILDSFTNKIFEKSHHTISCVRTLLFSKSVSETLTNGAQVLMDAYFDEMGWESLKVVMPRWLSVFITGVEIFVSSALESFQLFHQQDVLIYETIKEQEYRIVLDFGNQQFSIEDILKLCK